MLPKPIMGIDPGSVSGAYALLMPNGQALVEDLPVVDKQVNASAFAKMITQTPPSVAVVELVGSMPKQGLSSTFKFGMGCGIIRGVLAALDIPVIQVTPAKWKRALGLNADKEKSRALAIRLYPGARGLDRKRDAGRAEALLLAHWYRNHDIV